MANIILQPEWQEIAELANRYQVAAGGDATVTVKEHGHVSAIRDDIPVALLQGATRDTEQLLNLVLAEAEVVQRKNGPAGKAKKDLTDDEVLSSTFQMQNERILKYKADIEFRKDNGARELVSGYHVALADSEPKLDQIKAHLKELVVKAEASREGLDDVRTAASAASGEGNNAVGDIVRIIEAAVPKSPLNPHDPLVQRQRAELLAKAIEEAGLDIQQVSLANLRLKSTASAAVA